jgi:hypothetical protein
MLSLVATFMILNEEITTIKASYTSDSTVLNIAEENKYSLYEWDQMPLKYNYDLSCETRANKIEYAIDEIEKFTSHKVSFVKVNANEDIKIICDSFRPEKEKDYLGKAVVKYLKNEPKILSARVELYEDEECEYPYVEIHELLHVLGQGHNNIEGSVMKAKQSNCLNDIELGSDFKIFDNIKEIYK